MYANTNAHTQVLMTPIVEQMYSLHRRYLLELSSGRDLPPLAGASLMASAALTAVMPSMQYFREQRGFFHSLKVVW